MSSPRTRRSLEFAAVLSAALASYATSARPMFRTPVDGASIVTQVDCLSIQPVVLSATRGAVRVRFEIEKLPGATDCEFVVLKTRIEDAQALFSGEPIDAPSPARMTETRRSVEYRYPVTTESGGRRARLDLAIRVEGTDYPALAFPIWLDPSLSYPRQSR